MGSSLIKKRKRIKPDEKVLLCLPAHQVDFVVDHVPIGEHLLHTLFHSKVWDDIVKIHCTLDELSKLADCLEAVKSTDEEQSQILEAVSNAISKVEQRYWLPLKSVRVASSKSTFE